MLCSSPVRKNGLLLFFYRFKGNHRIYPIDGGEIYSPLTIK